MTYAWQNPAQHRKRLPHDAVRETIGVVVKGCCRRLPVRIGVGAHTGRHALNLVVVGPQALRHVVGWLVGRRCTGVTSAAGVARNCWLLRLCCCTIPGRDLARQHPPRTHGRTQPRAHRRAALAPSKRGRSRRWSDSAPLVSRIRRLDQQCPPPRRPPPRAAGRAGAHSTMYLCTS